MAGFPGNKNTPSIDCVYMTELITSKCQNNSWALNIKNEVTMFKRHTNSMHFITHSFFSYLNLFLFLTTNYLYSLANIIQSYKSLSLPTTLQFWRLSTLQVGQVAQGARRFATDWTARGRFRESEGEIFFTPSCPDWCCCPLSLL